MTQEELLYRVTEYEDLDYIETKNEIEGDPNDDDFDEFDII